MSSAAVRQAWLQEGHAFCFGTHEEIRLRQWKDDPGVTQNILTCEHGVWFNIADAWADHEAILPKEIELAQTFAPTLEWDGLDSALARARALVVSLLDLIEERDKARG